MGQVGKNRLGGGRAGVAATGRLYYEDHDHVLRLIAADKADIGAVKLVVIIAAARLGDLGRAGLAADHVSVLEKNRQKMCWTTYCISGIISWLVLDLRMRLTTFGLVVVFAVGVVRLIDQMRLVVGAAV